MAMTKFRPYDDELICYLKKFLCGIPFVESHHIRQIDVYGDKKPCEIFDNSSDVNYFFTQLRRKTVRGKRFNRQLAAGGTWKTQKKQRPVFGNKESVIGFIRNLVFEEKNGDKSIQWSMKEYCLSDDVLKELREGRQIRHEDYVLCRIKRNVKFRSTTNNFQGGEENIVANQNHNLGSSSTQNQEKFSVSWTPSISKSSEHQVQALHENQEVSDTRNNNGSLVKAEAELLDPISPLPLISSKEENVSFQESTIHVASYHKELDAYAKAILEVTPPLVPHIPQELDDCPLFSEDFYIGHHALWS